MEHSVKKANILSLTFQEIERFVAEVGWKKYRAAQILAWLYARHVASFEEMSDLPADARSALAQRFDLIHPTIVQRQISVDGTEKFLLGLEDGNRIESVLIPQRKWLTLCISSQAGCTLDCSFCLTAEEKFNRNLKAHEIVGQLLTVGRLLPASNRITHIVLMGMGEPLANLTAVTEALLRMTSPMGLNLSPRRITVSTAGLAPQIDAFLNGPAPVNLSVSLNATTNAVRDRLMPKVNRLYPLETLLATCKSAPLPRRRRITFEYVLIEGVNDSLADAARLIRITQPIRCKINLIPFNPYPSSPYSRPSDERILQFQKRLLDAGLVATLRKSKGRDILAACGQLNSQNRPTDPIINTATGCIP